MSKHATPLRLSESLVDDAKVMSAISHRSTNEQIEYWAHIGQLVETSLSASDIALLLAEKAAVAVVSNQSVSTEVVYQKSDTEFDPLELMNTVAEDSPSGELVEVLKQRQHVLYEPAGVPGLLRAVYPNGDTEIGSFKNGKFKKRKSIS